MVSKNCIDLNGDTYGGIEQSVPTEKGKKYVLSFYMAGNTDWAPKIKKMLVSAADKSEKFEFYITGKTRENPGWEYCEMTFTATKNETLIRFESIQITGPTTGPLLGNVVLLPYDKAKHKSSTHHKHHKVKKTREIHCL